MKNARLGEQGIRDPLDPCWRQMILLAATPERAPPEINDMVTERVK